MKKVLSSLTDVEEALNELQGVEAQVAAEEAKANMEIAQVRDAFVASTGKLEETGKRLRNTIEAFASEYRNDPEIFPAGKKSIDLNAGTIGFRSGAPSVSTVKGFTSADVIENIVEARLNKQLLTQPEPALDKSKVKDLYESGKLDDKQLRDLGLKITESELFSIKLKDVKA